MPDLNGRRIAFLATDGVEQVELTEPWKAVERAGGEPCLVSLKEGKIQGFDHHDKADTFAVDQTLDSTHGEEFDALVLPGGVINPDALRMDSSAVGFVRSFCESGKPVAAICHGPWTLVEADAVRGRTMTSWPSLRTDLENAGANWVDEQVCEDGQLITSRNPDDLPAFCAALVEKFAVA